VFCRKQKINAQAFILNINAFVFGTWLLSVFKFMPCFCLALPDFGHIFGLLICRWFMLTFGLLTYVAASMILDFRDYTEIF